jgi:CBS domain containing-hemolysin-like protein
MLSAVIILAITFSVTALCSLVEACLLSLSKPEIAALGAGDASLGRIWTGFHERLARPLAAILILNTGGQTIGMALAAGRLEIVSGERAVLIASAVMAVLMIQWAEILPKTLGAHHRRRVAVLFGRPLHLLVLALTPAVAMARKLNRPFEGSGPEVPPSIDEIRALASDARSSDVIGAAEDEIIGRAAGLTRIGVREIMVPRADISALSTDMSFEEALIHAHIDAHTRFPLCEGGRIDEILGYVNLKELVAILHTNPKVPTLRGIARPIHRVSPDTTASALTRSFTKEHVHVAVVVDDLGKTLGMITMEDLVEQLVGDLEDEFDRLPTRMHDLGGSVLMVGGGAPMSRVLEKLGIAADGPTGSVSAFLDARLGRHPARGDEVRILGLRIVVRRIRRGRVFEATVTRAPEAGSP